MKKLKYVSAIIAGNALFAFAVAAFVIPNGILMGGITGVGIVLNKLFGINTALFVLIVNSVLMLAGLIILGKKFFFSTVASSLLYPLFLELFQRIPVLSNLTDDLLLSAIFAGALLGAAIGLLMRQGSSSGGTDIIGLIVNKYTHISVAVTVWAADIMVIGFQALTSSSESLLLGIIT
ncbi:MAG: YitT family protein, partial [Eubacterium sp.]|nr:YitT family protein [Eubacterium sp.]